MDKLRIRYDIGLLEELSKFYDVKILEKYDRLTRESKIKFLCHCGLEDIKTFRMIYLKSEFYCKKCTLKKNKEKIKTTNNKKYGCDAPSQNSLIKEKIKNTNLSNYGVENPFQNSLIKEKIKNTNLLKYDKERPSQNYLIQEKIKNTNIKKYGVTCCLQNGEIKEKSEKTLIRKYGVKHSLQSKEIKEKMIINNIKKYGVEYPIQTEEIQSKIQKNSKKFKQYIMPSGEIRKVQGYEPFALNELVKIYEEEDIVTERKYVPRFTYNLNDKNKYYFPDIFIKSLNKIIEVKSHWTYKSKSGNIKLKAKCVKTMGYDYEIWIFNEKGNKIIKTE